jgi:hypothetical protein
VAGGHPKANSKEAEKYMSKPKKPKTENLLKWQKYYERYVKFLIRHRKDCRLYCQRHKDREIRRHKKYRLSNREKLTRARQIKFSKPENRQRELERLFRYIDKNPFCNITKMERIIKIYERTVSLDAEFCEELNRYDLVSA